MLKYLLPAWKKALDEQINLQVKGFPKDAKLSGAYKQCWYHVCIWLDSEIEAGNIISEFKPFAHSYMEKNIKASIDMEEIYRNMENEAKKTV